MSDIQLTPISRDVTAQRTKQHESRGFDVDSRVWEAIEVAKTLSMVELGTKSDFFDLVLHERDYSRLLTPGGPRTLRDVAQRMITNEWTFPMLASPMGLGTARHSPVWFQKRFPISTLRITRTHGPNAE